MKVTPGWFSSSLTISVYCLRRRPRVSVHLHFMPIHSLSHFTTLLPVSKVAWRMMSGWFSSPSTMLSGSPMPANGPTVLSPGTTFDCTRTRSSSSVSRQRSVSRSLLPQTATWLSAGRITPRRIVVFRWRRRSSLRFSCQPSSTICHISSRQKWRLFQPPTDQTVWI